MFPFYWHQKAFGSNGTTGQKGSHLPPSELPEEVLHLDLHQLQERGLSRGPGPPPTLAPFDAPRTCWTLFFQVQVLIEPLARTAGRWQNGRGV